jgi:hypothetical protein
MLEIGDKLACLENATVLDDGERVAFTVKGSTGKQMRVHCPLAEIGDVFSFLGHLAKAAGEARNAPTPPVPHTHNYLAPVPAQGIGFQAGDHPDRTLLVVRLFGFDLAFEIQSNELARLADDISRIARTLSAGGNQCQ